MNGKIPYCTPMVLFGIGHFRLIDVSKQNIGTTECAGKAPTIARSYTLNSSESIVIARLIGTAFQVSGIHITCIAGTLSGSVNGIGYIIILEYLITRPCKRLKVIIRSKSIIFCQTGDRRMLQKAVITSGQSDSG